ncbi:GTP-binding protein [archaeon]|nr:MAG: GTP-binding protein [archaeon]
MMTAIHMPSRIIIQSERCSLSTSGILGGLCLRYLPALSPKPFVLPKPSHSLTFVYLSLTPYPLSSLSLASRGLITSTFPPATPKALQAKPYAVIPHRQTPIFTSPAPALTRFTSPEFDCILKLLLVGDQGAGKSSLLMRYSEDAFTDKFIATIGVDFKINNIVYPDAAAQKDVKIRMQVWDIAGPERFRTITSAYYRGAHGLLLCFAIADRESFTSASLMWVKEINKYNPLATVLLIGLKGDLSKQREVSVEEGEQAAQRIGALYCECSSKTGEGVDHVFATMVHSIMSDESAKASIINDSLARNKQRNKHVSPTGKPDIRNKCVIS